MPAPEWTVPSIETYTGTEFTPLSPRPEDVHAIDVAHALAMKCRYTGHSEFFYSVAQHSVLITRYARHVLDESEDSQRWCLLHDASEAYLPDVASPIKPHLTGYRELEHLVLDAVLRRFGLPIEEPPWLGKLDRDFYWLERETLLKPAPWLRRAQGSPPNNLEEMVDIVPIEYWSPSRAKGEWWSDFARLFPHEADPMTIRYDYAGRSRG